MREYMNEPIYSEWRKEDVIKEYNDCKDKRKVARIFQIKVTDVTNILKEASDGRNH